MASFSAFKPRSVDTLDNQVQAYFGSLFHHPLNLLSQMIEEQHDIIIEKCIIKGSVVPIIIGLAKEPKEGLNDLDVQVIFRKRGQGNQTIEPELIQKIHDFALPFLKQWLSTKPLVNTKKGFINWQLSNLSADARTPVDLSFLFKDEGPDTVPNSSSSRDGFELEVTYDANRMVSFRSSQSAFISQFSSMHNSAFLYQHKQFTIPYDLATQVQGGLFIYLRHILQGWTYVIEDRPRKDGSMQYIPGNINILYESCFHALLRQYRDSLQDMKFSRILANQIKKHFPRHAELATEFLRTLILLNGKFATLPNADLEVISLVNLNLTACVQSLPQINQSILHLIPVLSAKIVPPTQVQMVESPTPAPPSAAANPEFAKEHATIANIAPPLPQGQVVESPPAAATNPEIAKEPEPEVIPAAPKKRPLQDIQTIPDYFEQAPICKDATSKDKAICLIRVLKNGRKAECDLSIQSQIEREVNALLKDLNRQEHEDEITRLCASFIQFINQFASINAPEQASESTKILASHIAVLLAQKMGKKSTFFKTIDTRYRSLSPADKGFYIEAICDQFLQNPQSLLNPEKAKQILNWIVADAPKLTLSLLKHAHTLLKLVPETAEEFQKKASSKKMDSATRAFLKTLYVPPSPPQSAPLPEVVSPPDIVPPSLPETATTNSIGIQAPTTLPLPDITAQIVAKIKEAEVYVGQSKWIKALLALKEAETQLAHLPSRKQSKKLAQISQLKHTIRDHFEETLKEAAIYLPTQETVTRLENYLSAGGIDFSAMFHLAMALKYVHIGQTPTVYFHIVKALQAMHAKPTSKLPFEEEIEGLPDILPILLSSIQQSPLWPAPLKAFLKKITADLSQQNLLLLRTQKKQYDFAQTLKELKAITPQCPGEHNPKLKHRLCLELATYFKKQIMPTAAIELYAWAIECKFTEPVFASLCDVAAELHHAGRVDFNARAYTATLYAYQHIRTIHPMYYLKDPIIYATLSHMWTARFDERQVWQDVIFASLNMGLAHIMLVKDNGYKDPNHISMFDTAFNKAVASMRLSHPELGNELDEIYQKLIQLNHPLSDKKIKALHQQMGAFEKRFQQSFPYEENFLIPPNKSKKKRPVVSPILLPVEEKKELPPAKPRAQDLWSTQIDSYLQKHDWMKALECIRQSYFSPNSYLPTFDMTETALKQLDQARDEFCTQIMGINERALKHPERSTIHYQLIARFYDTYEYYGGMPLDMTTHAILKRAYSSLQRWPASIWHALKVLQAQKNESNYPIDPHLFEQFFQHATEQTLLSPDIPQALKDYINTIYATHLSNLDYLLSDKSDNSPLNILIVELFKNSKKWPCRWDLEALQNTLNEERSNPSPIKLYDSYMEKGQVYFNMQAYQQASLCFKHALDIKPTDRAMIFLCRSSDSPQDHRSFLTFFDQFKVKHPQTQVFLSEETYEWLASECAHGYHLRNRWQDLASCLLYRALSFKICCEQHPPTASIEPEVSSFQNRLALDFLNTTMLADELGLEQLREKINAIENCCNIVFTLKVLPSGWMDDFNEALKALHLVINPPQNAHTPT